MEKKKVKTGLPFSINIAYVVSTSDKNLNVCIIKHDFSSYL